MRIISRIFILFFILFFAGCSLLPSEIKIAEQIMESNPDSALHLLQRLEPKQAMTNSNRALYGLLLFQALDKNKLPLKPDSLINFSIDYFQNKNDKSHLASCYFYKARMYMYSQHYDEATVLYLKALDNSQENKDFALLSKIYGDIGYICYVQRDFKEARLKYKLAVECLNQIDKKVDARYRLLDIGRTYFAEKDYKTADSYFRKALFQCTDSVLMGAALQEIGINYFSNIKYDSAQSYLRKSMNFPYIGFEYAIRCYTLADLFYTTSQFDSVYVYATLALKHPSNFYTQRECYRLLANTAYKKGDFKLMASYMTSFQSCTDSVRTIESQTKTSVLEGIHQTTQKAGKTKKYLIVLGWILPIIIILSLFTFFRLRIRNKSKEQELEQVEQQLSIKQTLLRESLIQKIKDAKSKQEFEHKKATFAQREIMDKDLYNSCLHLNNWEVFEQLMNHTFNNLVITLKSNYPEITHKEITWCCLFLLHVPTPEVLLLLDYKQDSLYKLKQRLVQKMNLKNAKELDILLEDLVEGK